jgi:hypothetical protein
MYGSIGGWLMQREHYQQIAIGAALLAVVAITSGRLPRWMRTTLVVALLALAAGAGLFAYRYVTNPVTLTVAAGSLDGDVPRFMAALASRMSSSDAGVRLKVVDKGTAWEAAKAFSAGDVDLAVVKSRCRRSISGADRGCRYTRCRTDRCASGNFYLGYG